MTADRTYSPKIAAKRETIMAFSLTVFAKEGFHNADVQVIADLSNVGKGTVYRNFGNKQQLFLATSKYCLEKLRQFATKAVGGEEEIKQMMVTDGVAGVMRKIGLACAQFYQKHPQAVEIMIQERAEFRESVYPSHLLFRAENRDVMGELIAAAIANGEFRTVDVQTVHNTFGDLVFGSVINGCLEGGKKHLVKRVESALDLLLNGLVAKPTK